MIEYEIPFVCLIFTAIITIVFFTRKKIDLEENYYYKNILIFTLLVNISNLVSHYMASIYAVDSIPDWFQLFFSTVNKLGSLFIIVITTNVLAYILYISFEKYRKNVQKITVCNYIFYTIVGIIIFLLDFKVYKTGGITSGEGSSIIFTYLIVFLEVFAAFFISIYNFKKYDRRYYALYFIIPIIIVLGLFVMLNPEFNIYDLILSLLCYLMYFSIENPDIRLLNQVENARDEAEKANRAKSDFLSSMSHEIRTPLNAIVGMSEDILSRKDELPKDVVEDAEDITTASYTLLEIVGNILDISKIESNKMEINNVSYDFKEEAHTLSRILATRIGDKNISFNVNIAEDIPEVLIGDKTHIKEIINNLITNAIKYTEEGEIDFTCKCINHGSLCNLMISVRDTGRGIKAEDINKLFNKFERLDIEKNSTSEGTGLGLSITKKLVEMMGGNINVESSFGSGSLFVVNIPQTIGIKEIKYESANKREVNYIDYSFRRVLIVDDNLLNIKVAKRALDSLGVQIDSCVSGIECIDKVKSGEDYDVILMDIMMPKMSGEECFKELKNIDGYNIPVIALTADAIEGAREKYLDLGFIDYIAKPFTKDQIKEKLDKIFSNNDTGATSTNVKGIDWSNVEGYVITSGNIKKE